MRHEITPAEAAAIHKARQAAVTRCGYCGRTVRKDSSSLDHYCDEEKALDEAELRAGTQ